MLLNLSSLCVLRCSSEASFQPRAKRRTSWPSMTSRSAPAAWLPLVPLSSITSQHTFTDALKYGRTAAAPLKLASNTDNGLRHQSGESGFHHRINESLEYGRKHVLVDQVILRCLRRITKEWDTRQQGDEEQVSRRMWVQPGPSAVCLHTLAVTGFLPQPKKNIPLGELESRRAFIPLMGPLNRERKING